MKNPVKAFLDVRKEELPRTLLMFGYFFLVITSFWILKPLKKTIFVDYYDADGFELLGWALKAAQAEQLAKVLNMGVAFFAALAFSALSDRIRREKLTYALLAFFLAAYGAYAAVIDQPGPWAVWTFYLFGDLFSTLMVAAFFAYLNDISDPDAAKRTYGPIGLGGVVGGVVGTMVLRGFIGDLPTSAWLGVCAGIAVLIGLIAAGVARDSRRRRASVPPPIPSAEDPERADGEAVEEPSPSVWDSARLVMRSRYLLSIVGIVGIYEMVSTIMDFQFSATVAHYLDGEAIGEHFATVYMITNICSLVIQLFFTSLIMSRLGVMAALLVLPLTAGLGSTIFLFIPGLWMGSLLNTADNAFNYSINQSARESLYVPTTTEEKYKAKAFIDMFVMRTAKALAVGVNLLVTELVAAFTGVRWLSVATLALILVWVFLARFAGRRFTERSEEMEEARGHSGELEGPERASSTPQ